MADENRANLTATDFELLADRIQSRIIRAVISQIGGGPVMDNDPTRYTMSSATKFGSYVTKQMPADRLDEIARVAAEAQRIATEVQAEMQKIGEVAAKK